jgi:hypothetical protein
MREEQEEGQGGVCKRTPDSCRTSASELQIEACRTVATSGAAMRALDMPKMDSRYKTQIGLAGYVLYFADPSAPGGPTDTRVAAQNLAWPDSMISRSSVHRTSPCTLRLIGPSQLPSPILSRCHYAKTGVLLPNRDSAHAVTCSGLKCPNDHMRSTYSRRSRGPERDSSFTPNR